MTGIVQNKIYWNQCVGRAQSCNSPANTQCICLKTGKLYASHGFRLCLSIADTFCPGGV